MQIVATRLTGTIASGSLDSSGSDAATATSRVSATAQLRARREPLSGGARAIPGDLGTVQRRAPPGDLPAFAFTGDRDSGMIELIYKAELGRGSSL